jgi:CRP/FNR family cyclic AMP-dependent transcriptional regulator
MLKARREAPHHDLEPIGILYGCPGSELRHIAELSRAVDVPVGHTLCEQGRIPLDCMLVVAGHADVVVGGRKVATIGPGETIGEMGVLDRNPRSATVVARSPMQVRVIDAQDLDVLMQRAPTFTRALLRELSSRVRSANHTS